MKAIMVSEFGGPDQLKYVDMDDPAPKSSEVILKSEAIGINYADVMMRKGTYKGGPQPPFVPGFEVCGTVVDKGNSVKKINIGDRILGFAWRGGYAEKVAVNYRNCLSLGMDLSPEQAVAVPVNFQTAYHSLHTLGQIKEGNLVLIHSAAGGVGTAAVQLAKAYGAIVIGTVGNDKKVELVEELGADLVINYNKSDFEQIIMDYTSGAGVDIALESVGGECFRKTLNCLKILGKMIVFGFSSGIEGYAQTTDLIYHSRAIMGFHLSSVIRDNSLLEKGLKAIQKLLDENKIHPVINQIFTLKDAKEAHSAIESRKTTGKVVLIP